MLLVSEIAGCVCVCGGGGGGIIPDTALKLVTARMTTFRWAAV